MVLTSDGKKIIGYSKGTNAASSGFIGTNDTIGVLEGTNACEVAFNGRNLNTFTFEKPTNAAFNTLVQSHVVHTYRVDPADGPTHPYKCTCFNNSNSTLYTRNTPGNFYINSNIAYMIRGNSYSNKMNALNIFGPGTLNNVTNVYGAFNNALMFDWNWDTNDCWLINDMFKVCDFNNSNIIFNTVNGGTFLSGSTNVDTCRVRQYGGNHLPGMSSSSINVVDFICNVNSGTTRFYLVNANVFNLDANLNNYSPTIAGFIESCKFVTSNISLNFNNSAMNVIINNTKCNANINNANVNCICTKSNGSFNITNSNIHSVAFASCTGAVYTNLFNCTLSSSQVINGNFNNSRINFNSCTHSTVIRSAVKNVIINEYNSDIASAQIANCFASNTKCYWNRCYASGLYNVSGSTEQHWEDSWVRYSLCYSNNSIHDVFFNNVTFDGNAIQNINNCKVNCNIIGSNDSAYYMLFNCNNSVANLNQNGNAGCPAGFCNNLKLNYTFNAPSIDIRTRPIQYVYNSNIYAICELNSCNHTLPFAAECRNTVIELHDYNRSSGVSRTVLINSSNMNLKYYGGPGRIYGVENSNVFGYLLLNDCNNISGNIVSDYQDVNMQNVTNSNIVLSPYGTSYYVTNTQIGYCNNVRINYKKYYNALPVNFNTCSNMYLTTASGNSVQFAPNNTRFDLDNVSLHNQMIVSNRCVALQAPNIFVQTITTQGANISSTQYNLEDNTLIGGNLSRNASYMAGNYKVSTPSNNVRCIGMINNLRFLSYPCFVTNSAMRVNITYGNGLAYISNSYYATNNMNFLNVARLEINNCAFIARDTSLWSLNQSYVNNSVCVLGGQSTKWNTNRNIQFDNCLVVAVNWNRATYNQVMFTNCILVSSSAFGVINNTTHFKSLSYGAAISKYNDCMPPLFKMPIEGFKMLTGVTDAPDSSDISI